MAVFTMVDYYSVILSVVLCVSSVSLCATDNYTEVHGDSGRTAEINNEIIELNKSLFNFNRNSIGSQLFTRTCSVGTTYG